MPREIRLFDSTLRDGEQSLESSLSIQSKMELAVQIARFGVKIIEGGFPASSPAEIEVVRLMLDRFESDQDPLICALARALPGDVESALKAIEGKANRALIHVFIGISPEHRDLQLRKSREEVVRMAVDAVCLAKQYCPNVEFSPMDATRAEPECLWEVVAEVIKAGATIINLPDTVGFAVTGHFTQMICELRKHVPNLSQVVLSAHCHGDLGMANSNAIEAALAGASQIEGTVMGIGERIGNTALEAIAMALRVRGDFLGLYTTVNHQQIMPTCELLSEITGIPIPDNQPIVGPGAFWHGAGVHTDGVEKDPRTFEIFSPEDIGSRRKERHDSLTARAASGDLQRRLAELGYNLPDADFGRIWRRFKDLADKKGQVFDEDLDALVEDELSDIPQEFELERIQFSGGTNVTPTVTIALRQDGEVIQKSAWGNGPVDAAWKVIQEITGVSISLSNLSLNSATTGSDAMAQVVARMTDNGNTFIGRGADTDINVASVKACLHALNKKIHSDSSAL